MTTDTQPLPNAPAFRLALTFATGRGRPLFETLFALDEALASVGLRARQPMLAQIRLAWWREELARAQPGRAAPAPLLASIAAAWGSDAKALQPLVDSYEIVLADNITDDAFVQAAELRAEPFGALAQLLAMPDHAHAAQTQARYWALTDRRLARGVAGVPSFAAPPVHLPRALRPVAVLATLAREANRRSAFGLMADRRATLAGIVTGWTGR